LSRLNKTRTDFQRKFEELIESYNAGSRNIEELFEELVKLSRSLSEEQQRHVSLDDGKGVVNVQSERNWN
jgi:type I restriction enzyme, R subunit